MTRAARRVGRSCLIFHARELPDDKAVDGAVEALDGVERAKASRFRSTRDRRRFIWRRYLRRHLLAEALGAEPGELVFATACPRCGSREHGKPYLPDAPHLHFSAAQSGDHTALGLGPSPLGIDIQVPSHALSEAATEIFTAGEQAQLKERRPDTSWVGERGRTALWARKEAYLKALGLGLSIEPAAIDARASGCADGEFGSIEAPGQASWSVASWTASDATIAIACATPRPVRLVQIAAIADPGLRSLEITATIGGHEGETGMVYASSGVGVRADLSQSR